MPLLAEHGFDWTLYLTSYYAQKQTQIMNVVIRYLCWKTARSSLDLSTIDAKLQGCQALSTPAERRQAAVALIAIGNTYKTAEARQDFVKRVAIALDIDHQKLENKRMFYLVNAASVTKMSKAGVDIQLHSHRHNVQGVDHETMLADLQENRNFISSATGGAATTHFCYPSGFHQNVHFSWLAEIGIDSATTCEAGLNYAKTQPMALNRFLDGGNIADIEFEAELSGFLELARRVRSKIRSARIAT